MIFLSHVNINQIWAEDSFQLLGAQKGADKTRIRSADRRKPEDRTLGRPWRENGSVVFCTNCYGNLHALT